MSGRFLRRFSVLGYCALIFFLSSRQIPGELAQYIVKGSDLIIHAIEYGILALLCYRMFLNENLDFFQKYIYRISWLFTVFYGLSDELHQYFVPSRCMSVWDWAADSAGAALVLGMIRFKSQQAKKLL